VSRVVRLLGKGPVVLGLAVLAGLVLVVASRTWVSARSDLLQGGAVAGSQVVAATGSALAPGAGALGLVVLAAAGALLLARPAVRLLTGLVLVLTGVAVVWFGAGVLRDPASAVVASVAEASGLTPGSVRADDLEQVRLTAWPVVMVAAGALVVAAGVVVVLRSGRWDSTRRFERPGEAAGAPAPVAGSADDWDALSRGEDPTAGMMDPRPPDEGDPRP
jgi:hypothetical protein